MKLSIQHFPSLALIFLIVTMGCTTLEAQENKLVDSLQNQLQKVKADTLKVELLNELAWTLSRREFDKALQNATAALKLAKKINYTSGIIVSNDRIGYIYQNKGESYKAIPYHQEALKLAKKIKDDYSVARASSYVALAYKDIGKARESIPFFQESLKMFKQLNKKTPAAQVSNNLGAAYRMIGENQLALQSYMESLEIREELNDTLGKAAIYLALGLYYHDNRNYSLAKDYYLKAARIYKNSDKSYDLAKVYHNLGLTHIAQKNYDEALEYLNQSLALKNRIGTEDNLAFLLNTLGYAFFCSKQETKALQYYQKSIQLAQKTKDKRGLAAVYNNMGILLRTQGQTDESIYYFKQALNLSRQISEKIFELEALSGLYKVYARKGDYPQSQIYVEAYIALRDSLELDYREAGNDKEMYNQKTLKGKDRQIKEIELAKLTAENQQKTFFIYALVVGILFLITLLYSTIRTYRSRQASVLARKKLEEKQQEIDKLLMDQELKSLGAMIRGQELERKRIAQDLHDRLGSLLSVVKLNFKAIDKNLQEVKAHNEKQYNQAYELLDKACDEVRKIAHNMVSGVLKKFGLISALEDMKNTIETTEMIQIQLHDSGFENERLDASMEIAIYRIIQELVSNALKHAEANELTIQLVKSKDNLNIIVEDDGKGFDLQTKDIESLPSMGLKNIYSRIKELNGELNIDSHINKGSTIIIDIPI
ncbi:MAG: sensor histidine kinase [Microscillaceae bacterium]|nr:sensor histidine kinase [Microscillaceae bacterium]